MLVCLWQYYGGNQGYYNYWGYPGYPPAQPYMPYMAPGYGGQYPGYGYVSLLINPLNPCERVGFLQVFF